MLFSLVLMRSRKTGALGYELHRLQVCRRQLLRVLIQEPRRLFQAPRYAGSAIWRYISRDCHGGYPCGAEDMVNTPKRKRKNTFVRSVPRLLDLVERVEN